MSHLVRAGLLILAVLAVVLVVPRVISAPEALEPYGFYRGAGDEEEWAGQPLQYADPSSCNSCHSEKHGVWVESKHSTVSCENCHGPGERHVENQAKLTVDVSRQSCGVCHYRVLGRPSAFPQVDMEQHGGTSACVTCHNPHDPGTGATGRKPGEEAPPAIPHALEGRTDCLLCHNSGGVKPFPENHQGYGQDACLACHRSQ